MSIPQSQRDLRIDLVRGIALLILVTDHLPGNPLRSLMPVSWGLADMAEAFVLLSGVVVGFGIRKRRTFQACTTHRLRRAVTLFVAYFLTAILLIAMVRYFQIGVLAQTLPTHFLAGSWYELMVKLFAINGHVSNLCILLLYFWLAIGLICLPDRIWKYPRVIFLSSFLLYLGSQLTPSISLPQQFQVATYFNPFAWQFLFVSGAIYANASEQWKQNKINRTVLFPLALLVNGVLLLIIGLEVALPEFLIKKTNLGPLRYLHAV
ncbi:OpgC domain-containing protein, partial [bacterium]|nr:OpgC domain-containing protein [bacterium]